MPVSDDLLPAARLLTWDRRDSSAAILDAPSRAEVAAALAAADGMMAMASLERAVSGEATIGDVGALAWLALRAAVPCTSLAVFLHEPASAALVAGFASGAHTAFLHQRRVTGTSGPVGSAAARRQIVLNGDPARDFGAGCASLDPPIASCAAAPLVYDGALLGVLAVYATTAGAFTGHNQRLLDLLAPSLATSLSAVVETPPSVPPAPAPRARPTHLRLVR
jgi:GAF domain-containing protein